MNVPSPNGELTMKRKLSGSLLIASMLVVTWATTSEACHRNRRRACAPATYYSAGYNCGGYTYAGTTGYYGGGGYYDGGTAGYPGGYGYGQPGYGYGGYYNPGGIGGPASGLGVRPGMGFGGLGRGR
jgi:hypothetical protein